jgi:hypothetical protein
MVHPNQQMVYLGVAPQATLDIFQDKSGRSEKN